MIDIFKMLPPQWDKRFTKMLNIKIDLDRLKEESLKLLLDPRTGKLATQLSLQTDGSDNWESGTGSQPGVTESCWDKLHPQLAGTWWEDFFNSIPLSLYRSRLMVIQPRTCYSIHTDLSPRIHIAVDTHPHARFVFTSPPSVVHIPADSYAWLVDTTKEHTAFNGSLKPRIHFVACLDNNDPN